MKKLLTLSLAIVFVLSFAACGNKDNNTSSDMQNGGDMMSQIEDGVSSIIGGVESGISSMTSMLTGSGATISAEDALGIALKDAGVTKDNITEYDNELERKLGILVYDIDFKSGDTEYSYEINAEDGAIIDKDTEKDYD